MSADQNVEAVAARLRERAERGMMKYGVDTTRGDLTLAQWLRHAQEEALDLAVYLELIIKDEEAAMRVRAASQGWRLKRLVRWW